MVIDSLGLVAKLFAEPDAEQFEVALAAAPARAISAGARREAVGYLGGEQA